VKFHSLRTSLAGSALAALAALLLGSCGGGGGGTNNTGGNLFLLPNSNVTFYAGMPATMNISGGRWPYRITSSQQGVFPVPSTISANSFTVIPNNPGVIDNTVQAGQLPVISVQVAVTDAENNFQQANIQVAQNFLTGYGLSYTSNCTPASGGTTSPPGCAGGETLVRLTPTFNGNLIGVRTLRIDTLRGPITWLYPNGQIAGDSVTLTTDHEGKAFAVFRADTGVPTQFVVFRVTDVETGVSTEESFILTGVATATALEILPDTFTFTGATKAECGTGSGQFLVFDGIPPYKAISTFADVTVSPASTDAQPGLFTFNAGNSNICLTDATIVVTDSRLVRGTVTITTEAGSADPPPPALRAIPSVLTLTCATNTGGTLIAGGGDPTAQVTPSTADPALTATAPTPRGVSIVFNNGGLATDVGPTVTSIVSITDGAQVVNVTVRHPTSCT
jgi:hypothetical protein